MTKEIYLIVATDQNNGIGYQGKMPWHFKEDLKHFANITTGHTVIMGRTTWQSLPESYRPLPGRDNIVLTSNPDLKLTGATVVHSLNQAIEKATTDKVFIIGGGTVYAQALKELPVTGLYKTEIKHSYDCDTFFPEVPEKFQKQLISSTPNLDFFLYS